MGGRVGPVLKERLTQSALFTLIRSGNKRILNMARKPITAHCYLFNYTNFIFFKVRVSYDHIMDAGDFVEHDHWA